MTSRANSWLIVTPGPKEEGADGYCSLYIKQSDKRFDQAGRLNTPSRPNNGTVRNTITSGWLDSDVDVADFAQQPWYKWRMRIGAVEVLDTWSPASGKYLFDGLQHCKTFDLRKLDTSACDSLEGMFRGCTEVVQLLDLDRLDVSKVRSTAQMFMNCLALRAVSVHGWKTDAITIFDGMFSGAEPYVLADENQAKFLDLVVPSGASGTWKKCNG